jgi:pimeloyl-ACP methyl ester carboxylesterase
VRRLRLAAIVLFVGAAGAAAWYWLTPWPERRLARVVLLAPVEGIYACGCNPDQTLRLERDDGLGLAASLYLPGAAPRSAVLIVHGNNPEGRRLPLYRVLARRLAERGHLVLTLDLSGFGESDDPLRLPSDRPLRFDDDVRAALRYLRARPDLQGAAIHAIGHSLGAIPVIEAAIDDPSVRSLVAFGSPRRTAERLRLAADREEMWKRAQQTYRQVYRRPPPEWFTYERWLAWKATQDLERWAVRFAAPDHKPLLLIDGSLEEDTDLRYLRDYVARLADPAEHVTLRGADHYANVAGMGRWAIYNPFPLGRAVDLLDRWVRSRDPGEPDQGE